MCTRAIPALTPRVSVSLSGSRRAVASMYTRECRPRKACSCWSLAPRAERRPWTCKEVDLSFETSATLVSAKCAFARVARRSRDADRLDDSATNPAAYTANSLRDVPLRCGHNDSLFCSSFLIARGEVAHLIAIIASVSQRQGKRKRDTNCSVVIFPRCRALPKGLVIFFSFPPNRSRGFGQKLLSKRGSHETQSPEYGLTHCMTEVLILRVCYVHISSR